MTFRTPRRGQPRGLGCGGLLHTGVQRTAQVGRPAFEKQFYVTHGLLIGAGRRQVLNAWAQAAADVVLQTGPGMKARQVDLARWNQKIAVNQVNDAVGQIGREVGTVVRAAVFAQPAGDVNPRPALAQGQLHVRVGLVVAQQDVESRFALLDEIVF